MKAPPIRPRAAAGRLTPTASGKIAERRSTIEGKAQACMLLPRLGCAPREPPPIKRAETGATQNRKSSGERGEMAPAPGQRNRESSSYARTERMSVGTHAKGASAFKRSDRSACPPGIRVGSLRSHCTQRINAHIAVTQG